METNGLRARSVNTPPGIPKRLLRALVGRYAGLVYHAAMRQTGNPDIADEVTQAVFIALAQKAGRMPIQTVLSGVAVSGHAICRFESAARRVAAVTAAKQEMTAMEILPEPSDADSAWERISIHLDEALNTLPKNDRDALLIRFFQNKSHKEVARVFGVSEDAS